MGNPNTESYLRINKYDVQSYDNPISKLNEYIISLFNLRFKFKEIFQSKFLLILSFITIYIFCFNGRNILNNTDI